MPKKEVPLHSLQHFLPDGSYDLVIKYLHYYKVHLTIAKERKTVLGDYRHKTAYANHRISVNGNLNKYAFLITTIHELAHLVVFEEHGNRVPSHGQEWKTIYARLLKGFMETAVFPEDIHSELIASCRNPAASSCAEDDLIRVLRRYDKKDSNRKLVEELPAGAVFRLEDGKEFRRGEKQRKRYKCVEIRTGKVYLFSPVYEVEICG